MANIMLNDEQLNVFSVGKEGKNVLFHHSYYQHSTGNSNQHKKSGK